MARAADEPVPQLSPAERQALAPIYAERLEAHYGDPHAALHFGNAYQLLIAVILSAQTTDVGVNKATPALFERFPTPADLAQADQLEVEEYVHTLGFYHQKAKNIIRTCQIIVAEFDGEVPDTMEGLTSLPGVARKTANIVLGEAFGKVEGIAVDTHVFRLAHRFGLTTEHDQDKVERDLMAHLPAGPLAPRELRPHQPRPRDLHGETPGVWCVLPQRRLPDRLRAGGLAGSALARP